MGKNIGKNIGKRYVSGTSWTILCFKYTYNYFKISNLKTAQASGDLIGNKITNAVAKSPGNKITIISKTLLQNTSETLTRKV